MDLLGDDGRILITRSQYDAALAQLPDPRTVASDALEVLVPPLDLYRRLNVTEGVPGTEDWPMPVVFEKVTPGGGRYGGISTPGPCWRLAPEYQLV